MSSEPTIDHLNHIENEALTSLQALTTDSSLEQWRIAHLGRKSRLQEILRKLGTLPSSDRRIVGSRSNAIKAALETALDSKLVDLRTALLKQMDIDTIDVTLPGRSPKVGSYHPITIVTREICKVLGGMGFQIVEGPEVEWDYYNFEKLNIPKYHPARDQFSTLWIDGPRDSDGEFNMLLRAHTSPMQARFMETHNPPIRIISPGKVWRYEATDATHESEFTQVEGLAVDKGITFANLRHTLDTFARQIFGEDRKVRFRCDYFPFVEPGVDLSVDCIACSGTNPDCRLCHGSGWLEIMGAGMVHPNVLQMAGYDPEIYTGFAFGLGPERIAMLKYGIEDIRLFHSNDVRFLRQFA